MQGSQTEGNMFTIRMVGETSQHIVSNISPSYVIHNDK